MSKPVTYYKLVNGELQKCLFDEASPEVQRSLVEGARQYMLYYYNSDWADDTSDSGWGYEYDNRYWACFEPQIQQMVIEDDTLIGFETNADRPLLSKRLLIKKKDSYSHYNGSSRHGSSLVWKIIEDPNPHLGNIAFGSIDEKDKNRQFTPADFPDGLVQAVLKTRQIQDYYGNYDGRTWIWLELTEEALQDRDAALEALSQAGVEYIKVVKYLDKPTEQ